MVLLNGAFNWFTKLDDLWQTILVAAAIFMVGLSVGLFFQNYKGLPDDVSDNTHTLDEVVYVQEEQGKTLNSIPPTLNKIEVTLNRINTRVSTMQWRIEVLSCYQEEQDNQVRECLERARRDFEKNPNTTSSDR